MRNLYVIIRTRNINQVNEETLKVLNDNHIEYLIIPHPIGKTFGEFNNEVFFFTRNLEDSFAKYIMFLDDDVIPTYYGIVRLMKEIISEPGLCGVSALAVPDNIKIARIVKATQIPNFGFGCCIIRREIISSFQVPPESECHEDDYFQIWCKDNGYELRILDEVQFKHHSDNWEKKYIRDWEWHIANGKLSYHGNVNHVSTFHYTEKGLIEQMVRWALLLTRHDRKLAREVPLAMRRAFDNPEQYKKNR